MIHSGSCHCAAIAFDVEADIKDVISCNCSMCRRKGSLLAFVPRDKLTLKTPESAISTYRFNKQVIQHHFCAVCGISPFAEAEGPNGPAVAINVRCLPDVDLEALTIRNHDGANA